MKRICYIALAMLFGATQGARAVDVFSTVEGNTITIQNIDEMALLAQNVSAGTNYSGITFLLATDLTYDGKEGNYTSIGSAATKCFSGTFDGQGHTISGINISAESVQGLFGFVSGATIKNIKLTNSSFKSTSNSSSSGIVGYAHGSVTIENCHVSESVILESRNSSGGIVGSTNTGVVNITGCTSAASITANDTERGTAGGIVGKCGNDTSSGAIEVNISNCLYYGSTLSGSMAGGIVGFYYTNERDSYSKVNLQQNFYTCLSKQGVGTWKDSNGDQQSNLDVKVDYGAVIARVVSASADIDDMGTAGTPVGGITPYTYGIAYGGHYYSHVLALENNADNTNILSTYNGHIFNVKLRGRTFYKDGSWNTFCLPFNLNEYSGTIFYGSTLRQMDNTRDYYISSDEGHEKAYWTGCQDGRLYLFFKETTGIEAGIPYIVKWDMAAGYNPNDPQKYDYFEPMFLNVTVVGDSPYAVTSKDRTVSFTPTYRPLSYSVANRSILFVSAANTLYYPNGAGTVWLKSFRAYFQLNGVQMADASGGSGSLDDDDNEYSEGGGYVKPFVIDIEDDADGIASPVVKTEEEGSVYNLSGQQVAKGKLSNGKLPRGIYIRNGRKEVVK